MSIQDKHNAIRHALAQLGYHVRCEAGYTLSIVKTMTCHDRVEATLLPDFCVSTHDNFPLYIGGFSREGAVHVALRQHTKGMKIRVDLIEVVAYLELRICGGAKPKTLMSTQRCRHSH